MVYIIQVCWQLASKLSANLYNLYHCCVYSKKLLMMDRRTVRKMYLYVLLCIQWKTPDDGQGNCPKHVEFCSRNKFEELVHLLVLFFFFVRTYLLIFPFRRLFWDLLILE